MAKTKDKSFPLVRIIWRDICGGDNTWLTLSKAIAWAQKKYDQEYETIGYLIFENSQLLIVAGTKDNDDDQVSFNDISMVMKSVVIRRERLHV